jgi:hypothetical protein
MRSDGAYPPTAVIAGLVPATPMMGHGRAILIGVAGIRARP